MLEYILNKTSNEEQGDSVLQLFSNDATPSRDDTVSTYTECTAGGYSEQALTGDSWDITLNSGIPEGIFPQRTFNFLESENIFGYVIKNPTKNTVLFAEKFSTGVVELPSNGGIIKITPKIRLRDLGQ